MNEDKRPPASPTRPRWSRRIFTTDREEASRTSRAATAAVSSCSSIRPVLPDGPPDEDPTAINAAEPVSRPNNQGTKSGPLYDEAQSLLPHSISFEQGFEDLGCYDGDDDATESRPKISATLQEPSAAPRLQYPPPGLAADMGDSPCLVALTSQQRHYKTSTHPLLQARDSKFLGSRSQEGGTSQARTGAPEFQGDPAVPDGPSVEVILGREIKPIDRQHSSRSGAMPGLGRQKKSSTPFSELDAAERASPSVASTSTRKPPAAGAKGEAAPAAERQSLKIDISFGKPTGADKDGKLLKSISTNVEKIVARLLTRHAEDRRPLSRVDDTETAVIELDSQRCVSVDVTMADDAGERRQTPVYPASPASQAGSKDGPPATPNEATMTPTGTSTGGEPAERRRHDGSRRTPTPTSVVHLTIGPISFGHSQPAIQHISQPESVQKAKRGKASADKLSTARTPTEMPSETAAFRALEKSLTPAAGSANEQAKPPEVKHPPLAPASTDTLLKQPKTKQLPPAQASPGKPLKPSKEPQFSSETGSIPDTQMKPAKESGVTRLRAVDKDHAAKRDAESVRKLGPASTKRSSEESLPSVHEMSAMSVSEKVHKRPAATGSTKMRRPSAKMSMLKDGAPSAPVQAATNESKVLSPETGEKLPGRKKSTGGKKAKEIPVKSPVSPEETQLQQKTKQARPAHKADAQSKLSSPDKGKLPSGRKKSVTEKHPPTAPAMHDLVKSPVSAEETLLSQKTEHAMPVDKTLRESQVSSPESGKLASKRKKSPRRKKSTAGQKPATTASAKDSLKRASGSPEEVFLKAAATSPPSDKEAVTSDELKKMSPAKEKDLTAAPATLEVSGKPTTTEDAHKPEQVVPKEASEEKGPVPEHADEGPMKPAGHEKESPKKKRKKSLKASAKDGDQDSKPTTTSEKRKKSLKSPDKADIGIEKSLKERSQVEYQPKPSETGVPMSTEDKKVSSDERTVAKDQKESAAPEGAKSQEASAHTTSKTPGTEKATKEKAVRKASAHGDRESTKMLSEELRSIKGDQQGEQQTLTQDTSLHSILKRHHRSKGSKMPEKATKDADGEAAEKRSKVSEDTKSSAAAGRRASRHKDVSSKEPEVPEKGLTVSKPSKAIAAEEDKAPTKEEAKHEGGPHELDRPTTTKTVESETGEPVSKSIRKRKSLAIDASAAEHKDPDAVAIERARKQSLVRTEHSQLDEKDLDDFLIGFELALDPYRVLVGLKPATSSQDEEGASKKGSKRSKDRKHDNKGRRTSIVRIHKTDIERKKKKGHSGVESPSPLAPLAPESAAGEQTADTDRKGKRKKSKSKYASSKARKSATTAEETGVGATAATESPTTRDSRRQKTSATSRSARGDSQPVLKGRSAPEGERLPADEAGGLPSDRQFLEDEEEDEARRKKKKERKKRKKEGGKKRKHKKRKRKRKKRNRPIGYRSGRPTCQILCPIAVGLLFALIILFLLLRALATASTATLPTTTTYPTFTYPTPRSTTTASTQSTVPPPVTPALPPTPPPPVPTKPPPVPPAKVTQTSMMPPVVSPTITPPPPVSNVYVCPTEVCSREARYLADLLKTIDSKPCENLLAYVCDGWSLENPAGPEGVGSFVSRGTMIQDALAQELLDVIRSAPDEDLKIAAALHASCTARPASESALAFAQNMFRTWVINAWPRNASATSQATDVWLFAAEVFRDFGISALLEVTIGVSPKGVRQAVVELDRPQLLFYRSDESSAEVDAMLRGAVEEALTVFTQSSSPEVVDQTKGMFVELARLPDDGQPDTSGTPERWILVEFSKLDGGLQNFLGKLFDNIFHPGAEPDVVLKSPTYIREGLVHFVNKANPVQALNYVGFLVVVRLAPFLPDTMTYVRGLFVKSMLGRSFRDVTDSSKLCLLAVESLLPNCFAKAAAILRKKTDADLGVRDVFSRLKTLFGREIQHLEWLGELSALFVRYNLRKNRVIRFGPRPGSCVRWQGNAQDSALKRYFEMSLMRQQEKLQAVLNYSAAANALAFESELDTEVRYDPTRRVVHVPAAIMNSSTRTNDSFFALHLSRVATRLYRAMVKMLTEEEPYGGGPHTLVPGLTENSTQALGSLLGCIQNNLELGPDIYPFTKTLRKAVLEQAVAIHLAFRAFREMLHVRRIWDLDYRLPNLNLSADQLFFLYFALDNCYTADSVYRRRQPRAAEDFYRVHLPLRYLQEFSDAFECNRQPVCKIFR
ncbi:hypothetical protein HPB49_016988 [Dermacentor silvarum]|uniref:Uncharacterized protein n=1 Tax=Dermacentor silvarum TaxID=543639 RepID=A0ACB8CS74_DERSI|nr:hypothetical protein HPB49_016988 [Dermacentor silvarum]